jgi:RNA-directed DNA polymerase
VNGKEELKRVYERKRLNQAWQQVRRNAGAAGIDEMTVEKFGAREEHYLNLLHNRLKAGKYQFKPARRVLIPKPGRPKERRLGIPTVMDRIVSQSTHIRLAELFEPEFTRSNFGFRPGKSQQQAIGQMREWIREGREWAVSIDLENFFDEIPHNLILKLVRRKVKDERMITLIARALKAGVIVEGRYERTEKGTPQGSPLSPIVSNIVLNELDQELERRGHKYCRWADDFVILLKSERAGKRVLEGITRYLEEELGLKVNKEKSKITKAKDIEFVGFQILGGKIRISTKGRREFKVRVRELTRRNNPLSMRRIVKELDEYLRGWLAYYRIQEFKRILKDLDGWIRSRLRSMQLKKWKKSKKFQKVMRQNGYGIEESKRVWIRMGRWQSVMRQEVKFTLNLEWFRRLGLVILDDYTQRNLELQFSY